MNLLSCYVHSQQRDRLVDLLKDYSGFSELIQNAPVPGPPTEVVAAPGVSPSIYIVNRSANWIVIEVNSVLPLYELGRILSAELNTVFLQTTYCASIDFAYLLLYDKGKRLREIEARGSKEVPDRNIGALLSFEQEEELHYFDLDMIANHCQHFGIDISNLFEDQTCTVLQDANNVPMVRLDHEKDMQRLLYPLG